MPRWFGAARSASIAFVERFRNPAPDGTLFHYTSTAALVSIIQNNELWLSDVTFLNDRIEIEHGRRIACGRIEAAINAEQRPAVRQMLELALEKFSAYEDPHIYAVCFSLEGDDLSQWRAYGQGDSPIAIEIEYGPLMFGYVSEGHLQQVLYQLDEQSWTFDQVLSAYIEAYAEDIRDPRPSPRPDPIPEDEEREVCAASLYDTLWHYITAFKNTTFQAEREVRFTYTAHDFSQVSSRDWFPEHPEPMFRERAGRIIPYLSSKKLNFRNMKSLRDAPKLPIRSIRIGPTDDPVLIRRGVRRLLDNFDHKEVEIKMSGSPYRSR